MKILATKMMNLTYCALKNRNAKENHSDSTNPTKEELKKVQDYMNAKAVNHASLVQTNSLYEVKKLVADVENSINSGLEDKILEYDTFVKKMLKKHKGKNTCQFKDSNGVIYRCYHNMSTISISQEYKGIPYNQNFYYLGYPDGKLPNYSHQTAYIYPCRDRIEYEFRDYNLDDTHGYTDAIVSDGKFILINTGHDMLAPVKYNYRYDKEGNLKSADVIVYNKRDYKGKNARMIFNKDRKVEKIYYGIERNYKGEMKSIEEIYTITPDGLYKKEEINN